MESKKFSRFLLPFLPYDAIMDIITHFDSLQHFVANSFQFIVRAILANHFQHPEMYRYLYAIMTARHQDPHEWIHHFLEYFFTDHNNGFPVALPGFIPRSIDTLYYMGEVLDGVQFYVPFGQRLWDCALRHNRSRPEYPPAHEAWITLALLRIQLYAGLFHQPLDSSDDGIKNWEIDLLLLKDYWDYFASLPLFRMCKYFYTTITVSVGHEVEYKWIPIDRAPDDLCLRGLPQVCRFMKGKLCTSFGLGYVRRLVRRGAQALEYLDPESGVWHHKRAIRVIFGWEDGPHGGLGQTRRHSQYLYPTNSPFHTTEWVPVSPGYLDEEDFEIDSEGEGESEGDE